MLQFLKVEGDRLKTDVAGLHVQGDSDSNDASQTRTFRSTLTMTLMSSPSKTEIDVANMGDQDQERTKEPGMEKSTMPDPSDSSTSRDDRCSMSAYQKIQQLVTPVQGPEDVEPTRVNVHDIDECLVTNKHTNGKQDSTPVSNQWLSNAFSKITFGIWDKTKINPGEGVVENANTNQLTFTPEFNFPL